MWLHFKFEFTRLCTIMHTNFNIDFITYSHSKSFIQITRDFFKDHIPYRVDELSILTEVHIQKHYPYQSNNLD